MKKIKIIYNLLKSCTLRMNNNGVWSQNDRGLLWLLSPVWESLRIYLYFSEEVFGLEKIWVWNVSGMDWIYLYETYLI